MIILPLKIEEYVTFTEEKPQNITLEKRVG